MKKHNFLAFFSDLGSASDWLKQISQAARPIRNTTQIWVVTRHQYGISALVSQTSFGGKTSGGVAKCPQTNYLGCSQLSVVKPDTLLSFQFNNTPKKPWCLWFSEFFSNNYIIMQFWGEFGLRGTLSVGFSCW